MNIFFEKPNGGPDWKYVLKTNHEGKEFWVDWSAWIQALVLDKKGKKNLLPKEIADFIPKWEEYLKTAKELDTYPGYPIKLVKIYFVYNDKIYKLTPEFFSDEYETRYYFYGAHENIEKDLQGVGCLYTEYSDELD